jgi:hypothetical protein
MVETTAFAIENHIFFHAKAHTFFRILPVFRICCHLFICCHHPELPLFKGDLNDGWQSGSNF